MNTPKILAPAGGWDSFVAAVRSGADCVYFGAQTLNARRNAGNFSDDELREAVRYAHIRGVECYVTLNISLFDSELDEARRMIELCAEANADALIVTDLAVIKLCREICPQMPLHGSTQMSVHSVAGAKQLQELGLSQVVLARELSAAEIRNIAQDVDIGCEIFVHGALCMSVSGQCYISSMLGGRSGNRGLCAQPCRLPWQAGHLDYALSLKDLSLVSDADELRSLGVVALKIEGRMKRPEYVAAAVCALKGTLAGKPDPDMLRRLEEVFSRSGFTKGYFEDRVDRKMFGTRGREDVLASGRVLDELAALYRSETSLVPVLCDYTVMSDQPLRVRYTDEQGRTGEAAGAEPSSAKTAGLTSEFIAEKLGKLGGTPYYITQTQGELDEGLYLPVSTLNEARRDATEQLSDLRAAREAYQILPWRYEKAPTQEHTKKALRGRFRSLQGITPDTLALFDTVAVSNLDALTHSELLAPLRDRVIVTLPRMMMTAASETAAAQVLAQLCELGYENGEVNNMAHLQLLRRAGFTLHGGMFLNLTNSLAVAQAAQLGLRTAELSFELSRELLAGIASPIPVGIAAYGRLPLMLLRNCPVRVTKGCSRDCFLTDRLDVRFPLRCEGEGSELLNSVPLSIAGHLRKFPTISFVTLLFDGEPNDEVAHVVRHFRDDERLPPGYTKGLYFREVL